MKKNILWLAALLPVLLHPSIVIAAPYCNAQPDQQMMGQMHNGNHMMGQMHNADAQSVQTFNQKSAELNKLYAQGVKENDKRAQVLIKDLDNLSRKMYSDTKQPYRDHYQQHGQNQYRGGFR